jgi:hypothetical protein
MIIVKLQTFSIAECIVVFKAAIIHECQYGKVNKINTVAKSATAQEIIARDLLALLCGAFACITQFIHPMIGIQEKTNPITAHARSHRFGSCSGST